MGGISFYKKNVLSSSTEKKVGGEGAVKFGKRGRGEKNRDLERERLLLWLFNVMADKIRLGIQIHT